jgi:HSP20 family protein
MTVVRWTPSHEAMSLRDAMNRLFEDSFVRSTVDGESRLRLPLDVYTTPSEIVILANVPGLKADEVDITLEGDTLSLSGEIKPPMENVEYIFHERGYGKFSRTLTLNVPVEQDKVEASFEDGVLKITLPKTEAVKPKTIKVTAK